MPPYDFMGPNMAPRGPYPPYMRGPPPPGPPPQQINQQIGQVIH